MNINPADVSTVLSLLEIISKAKETLSELKDAKPEVFEHIGQHHADAGKRLDAAIAAAT